MSRGCVNKVILIGNLGADPETRTVGEAMVANLSLGVSDEWTDKQGNKQQRTEWIRIVLWRKPAEIAAKFLHKGDKIYVEGKMKTRKWTDKDGVDRYTTEVEADTLQMLGGKRTEGDSGNGTPEPVAATGDYEDGLPFDEGAGGAPEDLDV
jgi:single-strand DNA-binding protein